MKIFFSLFYSIVFVLHVFSQEPEKIYGKNIVLRSNDYYLQQRELWKKETEKNPRNADAWYNYYRADRNAYVVGEETDSLNTKGVNRFVRLEQIVSQMEKAVPGSYEFHFVKWLNGNNDPALFSYLDKAHQLAPEKTEPLMSLVYYYETQGNPELRKKYAKDYYNSGEFSPGILIYGENILSGLDKEAIIFTEGDKDTDAILLLQNGKGIRTDVHLLNLNLLLIKDYRERIFRELGIAPFPEPLGDNQKFEFYRQNIIAHVAKNTKKCPVYVAVSVSESYRTGINKQLYLTGLCYAYSLTELNETELLKKNLNERYSLDYLVEYNVEDMSIGMMRRFNMNYLPALLAMYMHYTDSHIPANADPENQQKAEDYLFLFNKVAADSPDK